MSRIASLQPLAASKFGFEQAAHLLNRAGFGGTRQQIEALQRMGLNRAVDYLVDYDRIDESDLPEPECDPDIMRPPTAEERELQKQARTDEVIQDRLRAAQLFRQELDAKQMVELERWWLGRLIATPRPLQEKLTLLWHGHFASHYRAVGDSYLMLKQNQFFRTHAAGSFADLALGIVRDPAMIKFLNNNSNRKGRPNENLARELMELFTLGEGNYTEEDIKEGARALTGYTYQDNDFHFDKRAADMETKTILGQTGMWDGESFVRILLNRQDCPTFIAYKLYRHFVADIDDGFSDLAKSFITQLARLIWTMRYQLKPALKAMFRSQTFYDPAIMGNQIKSPAQLLVGTVRMLDMPVTDINLLGDAMNMMGQKLFNPPSVAGWYGGRSWINTSTLFVRQNLCTYLLTGKLPFRDGWSPDQIELDPSQFIEGLEHPTPGRIVDHLLGTFCAVKLSPERREPLVKFLAGRANPTSRDALIGVMLLITAMPEYQLC